MYITWVPGVGDTKIINVKTYYIVGSLFFVQLHLDNHGFKRRNRYVQSTLHVLQSAPGVGPEERHRHVLIFRVAHQQHRVGVWPANVVGKLHPYVHLGGQPLRRGHRANASAVL